MRHEFGRPDDVRAMQDLASRLWSPSSRFHPGQLAWNHASRPIDAEPRGAVEAAAVWSEAGRTLGFGWAEAPDWLELQVDPARPDVAAEVVDWFEEVSDAETQSALVMEGDVAEQALAAAGFTPRPDEPYFTHHILDLADLADLAGLPPVPEVTGYRLRHVEPHEARQRAAVHAAAWSDVGASTVDEAAYRRLMGAWPYRPDLDWVAVDGDGEMVASALVWLDEGNGVGLVEPVGCVPDHRGRGLARAVTLAALHRLAELGGTVAQVSPRGDAGYPGPQRLYRSLGFRPSARTVTWTRSLT
ncbi:GNAT family N-acetyltransferase [Terrabacter aerolatus]|uniref:N-acetyltransferase n=1 Tax=Terrabacter aerolatus TaxID=422442 RepID=A0A512CX35_9MICO|nr:GNAT family N-acetyltransferase [Terrabacter aerolatus]GEO28783.1 N-acetyltransferase [Terrabacter aerolatus]